MHYLPWFKSLGPYLMAERHTTTERQESLVTAMLSMSVIVYTVFSIVNYFAGFYFLSAFELLLVVVNYLCLLVPNEKLSIEIKGRITVFATTSLLLMLFAFGGIESTGIYWLPILPFIIFSLIGIRKGWLWLISFILGIFTLQLIDILDVYHIPYTIGQTLQFLSAFITFIILAFIFEVMRLQHYDELEYNNSRLMHTREVLRKTLNERESEIERQTFELKEANKLLQQEMIEHEETNKVLAVTEKEFYQSQKMESLGNLVSGVAKFFSNTLLDIGKNLFLIQRNIKGNDLVQDKLDEMEKSVFHASDMTKQLLTFARKDNTEKVIFDVSQLIKDVMKLVPVTFPPTLNVKVKISTTPMPILGSLPQLQQVMLNLLSNAGDAVADCEERTVKVNALPLEEAQGLRTKHPFLQGEWVYLSVVDSGSGIEAENLPHIFEPFFSTKGSEKSAGLGLAMCYGAIKSHSGIIEVDSQSGEGASFHIYLPMEKSISIENDNSGISRQLFGKGETLLIVDDDENIYEAHKFVLGNLNYNIIWAKDGREALKIYAGQGETIDLIMMDIVMPNMKGDVAAQEILKINPDAKIIFSSGYDSTEQLSENLAYIKCLNKPFTIEQLCKAIREELD